MTDGPIAIAATCIAVVVSVAGIILPQITPAADWVSVFFGLAFAALIALWIID